MTTTSRGTRQNHPDAPMFDAMFDASYMRMLSKFDGGSSYGYGDDMLSPGGFPLGSEYVGDHRRLTALTRNNAIAIAERQSLVFSCCDAASSVA